LDGRFKRWILFSAFAVIIGFDIVLPGFGSFTSKGNHLNGA
jgi:hypothetical protein